MGGFIRDDFGRGEDLPQWGRAVVDYVAAHRIKDMAARPPFRGVGVNVFDAGLVTASHEEISRKQGVSLLAIGR